LSDGSAAVETVEPLSARGHAADAPPVPAAPVAARPPDRAATGAAVSADLASEVDAFLEPYRREFRRRGQALWAAVYLQGLLRPGGRKNIENLTRVVTLPPGLRVEDAAQALQHFINQSPWDEERLWARHQALLAARAGAGGAFVFEELPFLKQGRHSAGVQRQFSRRLGRKVNCQLAVVLHHVGPAGHAPLALRLYLPKDWLQDPARLEVAGVPASYRAPASKLELALGLLDAARTAGVAGGGLAAGPGWADSEELRDAAAVRDLQFIPELPADLAATLAAGRRRLLEDFGLEHFEGRSWRGFHHHACLVMLAHAFPGDGPNAARVTAQARDR
jgi:SRSO17 transposase